MSGDSRERKSVVSFLTGLLGSVKAKNKPSVNTLDWKPDNWEVALINLEGQIAQKTTMQQIATGLSAGAAATPLIEKPTLLQYAPAEQIIAACAAATIASALAACYFAISAGRYKELATQLRKQIEKRTKR